jgi:hypothetical protein
MSLAHFPPGPTPVIKSVPRRGGHLSNNGTATESTYTLELGLPRGGTAAWWDLQHVKSMAASGRSLLAPDGRKIFR